MDHDAGAAAQRVGCGLDGAAQVFRPVGLRVVGRALGAGEDHRPRVVVDEVEGERGLGHGIGAVGEHDAAHIRVLQRAVGEVGEHVDVVKRHARGVEAGRVVDADVVCRSAAGDELGGGERWHERAGGVGGRGDGAAGGENENEVAHVI